MHRRRGGQAWSWLLLAIKLKVMERDDWKPGVFVIWRDHRKEFSFFKEPISMTPKSHSFEVRWKESSREEA